MMLRQLVAYMLQNHAFWAVAENARRLDEVEEASNDCPKFRLHTVRQRFLCFKTKCERANLVQADAAELPKKPKSLLERLEQRRKKRPGNALHNKLLPSWESIRQGPLFRTLVQTGFQAHSAL